MTEKFLMTSAVVALVLAGGFGAAPVHATPEVNVEDVLAVLNEPKAEYDNLPDGVDHAALGGIAPDSVRYLGQDALARYWVGVAHDSAVCLVTVIPDGNQIAASACASFPEFYEKGIGVVAGESREAGDRSTEAYLLPDDAPDVAAAHTGSVKPSGGLSAADGSTVAGGRAGSAYLVTGRPGALGVESGNFDRPNGIPFRFETVNINGGR